MLGETVESEVPAGATRRANVPYSERDQSLYSALDPLLGPAVAAHKTPCPPKRALIDHLMKRVQPHAFAKVTAEHPAGPC